MKYLFIILGLFFFVGKVQAQGYPNTDSLRVYNIKYITNNAATAFTNLRLHTLLRGIIDWIDTARAGTGGGGAIGIDTLYALNDSTIRYRKSGVFRNAILKGVYDTRRKVDTAYALNDSTLQIKINGTNRNIILPGRHWTLQGVLNNGSTLTENENIVLADSLEFTSGFVIIDSLRLRSLQVKSDTTTHKPLAVDASGNVVKMVGWPHPPAIDTANKWVNDTRRSNDSVYAFKNGSWQFKYKDSVGGGGSSATAGIQTSVTGTAVNYDPRINSNIIFNDFLLTTIGPKWNSSNAPNTTITFASGHMRLAGGNATDYIYDSTTTITHRWTEEVRAVIQSVGGSDYFSFGIRSQGIQTILFRIKNSDLSGTATYNNGATTLGTTPAQGTTVVGDSVIYRIRRDNYVLYFDVINVTQSTSQTLTYNYTNIDAVAGTVNPFRAFSITLNPEAGTIDIDYAKLYNQERLYADWLVIGHSIADGFNAGPPDSTYYNRLQTYFPDKRFGLYAISGSKAIDFTNSGSLKDDMLALRPRRALIMLGINEIQASISTTAFVNSMRALVDTIENHGTQVIVCNTTPYNGANKAAIIAYNSALLTEFGPQLINIYDTLEIDGLMQSSNDSLHPDAPGHRYLFNVLKDEITRLANTPYDPEGIIRIFPRGIESGRSKPGVQSNFGIIPINIGGSGTLAPGMGYNVKFLTTNAYNYLASDYANLIQLGFNGKMVFKTAVSGAADNPITFTDAMTITPVGDIGNGEITPLAPYHIKRNQSGKTTLGEASMLILDNTSGGINQRQEIGMGYRNGNAYNPVAIGNVVTSATDFTTSDFYIATRAATTNTAPIERFRIGADGKIKIHTADIGSSSDSGWTWNRSTNALEYSKINSGITSINSQTGPAITIQGGTGTSATTTTDTVTVEVVPSSAALPHTLDAVYTTQGNTGTSETDLFSYTLPANRLGIDGRTVNFEIDGEVNDATATAQIKLHVAGNTTLNTGAVNISTAPAAWRLKGYIIRTSSTTAHVTYELDCLGLATQKFIGYSNLTSLDFTTTNIIKISAQAGGAGGGNSDITAHSWQLLYKPQPQ